MRKTLYLDFDGVLHPNLATESQQFVHLEVFCGVLRSFLHSVPATFTGESVTGQLDIVISSSWRFQCSISDLVAIFPKDIQPLILGTTGPAFVGKFARWEEIGQHVCAHQVGNWRALDDSAFEFPCKCRELILCDGATGMKDRQLSTLALWLAG